MSHLVAYPEPNQKFDKNPVPVYVLCLFVNHADLFIVISVYRVDL
jgi:hypothetical protein